MQKPKNVLHFIPKLYKFNDSIINFGSFILKLFKFNVSVINICRNSGFRYRDFRNQISHQSENCYSIKTRSFTLSMQSSQKIIRKLSAHLRQAKQNHFFSYKWIKHAPNTHLASHAHTASHCTPTQLRIARTKETKRCPGWDNHKDPPQPPICSPAPRKEATKLRRFPGVIRPPVPMKSHYSLVFFIFSHFVSSKRLIFHFSCLMHVSGFKASVWCSRAHEAPNLPPTGSVSGFGMTPESPWEVIKFQAIFQGNKGHENWS